jgi:hypothetical protein
LLVLSYWLGAKFSRGFPTSSYFLLLVQNKVTKVNDTPLPLVSFGLSAASGRLRNSPSKIIQAQTVLAAFPSAAQAEGAARESKVKTILLCK